MLEAVLCYFVIPKVVFIMTLDYCIDYDIDNEHVELNCINVVCKYQTFIYFIRKGYVIIYIR